MSQPSIEEYPYVYRVDGTRKGQPCRIVKFGWRTLGYGSVTIEFEDGEQMGVARVHIMRRKWVKDLTKVGHKPTKYGGQHGSRTSETTTGNHPKSAVGSRSRAGAEQDS